MNSARDGANTPPPADQVRLPEALVRALHEHLRSYGADADAHLLRWGRDLRADLETCLLQQTRVVLSMQIPLAEAPGFRHLLAAAFGEGFFLRYRDITDCHGRVVSDFPPRARCIHGHMTAEDFRARFPSGRLVTWVRHPVQRVAAQYHYWLREPDLANPVCRALHEQRWSLVDFARQDAMRNKCVRYFGRLRPADFAFVGLLEDFARSVDIFRHAFDITAVPLVEAYRSTPPPLDLVPLSTREQTELARLNEPDCRLYAECCAQHELALRTLA